MNRTLTALALGLVAAAPLSAQAQTPPMTDMPGMSMPGMSMPGKADAAPKAAHQRGADPAMPGMSMAGMSSSIDLNDPMSQEASGTAWLPASSPMYGKMVMGKNGDMLMLHGAAMPRYVNVGSKRGDRRFDAPNWFMGMYSHPLDAKSQLGLRGMFSLDPVTEGGYGYPLLFQTGESWHHQPLHDRQHPHDLVSELAATYSHLLGGGKSAYLYLGYPGEPALGPPTYMHRLLAYDLADAPIGHHWQDATHITFGVATAGLNFGSKVKVEASDFTGREPDENRYSFDKPRFDSYSGRASYNPDPNDALQVSYGFIRNAEGDGADQHRITASWLYNRPLGEDANFTTALVWGQNNLTTEGKTNSYLAEADYQHGRDTLFSRIENIQKSGRELVLPEDGLQGRKFTLGAYTLGYVRDLTHGTGIDTGLGFAVTADTKPSALDADYGGGTPISFQIYLRLRPSRMKMDGMKMDGMKMDGMKMDGMKMDGMKTDGMKTDGMKMGGMKMGGTGTKPMAGMTMTPVPTALSPAPAAPGITVAAVIAPSAPVARADSALTVTLTGPDGKPLAGAKVESDVAMTSMDMGTTHPAFREIGGGKYQASVAFAMAGPWRITLRVIPPGGGAVIVKALEYDVRR